MKTTDIAWIVIFSIPLVTMNAIGHCVRQYIRDKPLGMKSLHDVVFKDMLCVVQFGCSTFCLISMMSRFESVQQLMIDEPILLTFCCASYICAYISVGVSNSCICVIRIICIMDLTFVEDHLDETMMRFWAVAFPVVVSMSSCIFFAYHNDINTGTAVSLLTNSSVRTGHLLQIQLKH